MHCKYIILYPKYQVFLEGCEDILWNSRKFETNKLQRLPFSAAAGHPMPLAERLGPPLVTIKVGTPGGYSGLHRVQIHIADGFAEVAQSELNRYGELLRGSFLFIKQTELIEVQLLYEENSGPHGYGGVQLVCSQDVFVEWKERICGAKGCRI